MSTQPAKPLRRQSARSKVRDIVPGILELGRLKPVCDICNRSRAHANHAACSRQRQAKYRPLWEAVQ